jgi:hypothetical protein
MYLFLAFTQLLKTMTPYFRKHILHDLESHEYLFINTFFVGCFVLLFFIYKTIFHDNSFDQFLDKIQNLTILQVVFFVIIAFINYLIVNFDKRKKSRKNERSYCGSTFQLSEFLH